MSITREQLADLEIDVSTLETKADGVVDRETMFAIKTCRVHASEVVNMEDAKITKAIINAIYSLLQYVHLKTEGNPKLIEVDDDATFILMTLESWNLGGVICW